MIRLLLLKGSSGSVRDLQYGFQGLYTRLNMINLILTSIVILMTKQV